MDMSTTMVMPTAVTLRRSSRSAIWPAGRAKIRAGMNSARPMSPSVSGLPVRWNACQPRAAATTPKVSVLRS